MSRQGRGLEADAHPCVDGRVVQPRFYLADAKFVWIITRR
jgi:hypothetical protein